VLTEAATDYKQVGNADVTSLNKPSSHLRAIAPMRFISTGGSDGTHLPSPRGNPGSTFASASYPAYGDLWLDGILRGMCAQSLQQVGFSLLVTA
jgi:hypothetical protein